MPADRPQAIFERAVADFLGGRIAESVTGFDKLAAIEPGAAAQLWQRGIALYYVGRYKDCRAQFESHRLVNPNDVENAAWHFLCVARAESPEKARAALLPVGPDARSPMKQIYEMFRGVLTPEAVLAAAGSRAERPSSTPSSISGCTSRRWGTRTVRACTSRRQRPTATRQWEATCTAVARIHLRLLPQRR